MRIFISYSLNETDQHIASLLAQQARARGFEVAWTQQQPPLSTVATQTVEQALVRADVVIAIVSNDSTNIATARKELSAAVNLQKPVVALVEKGTATFISVPGLPYVEFDRYNPGPALAKVGQTLEAQRNKQNVGSWVVIGGLAVLALYLLSGEDKS